MPPLWCAPKNLPDLLPDWLLLCDGGSSTLAKIFKSWIGLRLITSVCDFFFLLLHVRWVKVRFRWKNKAPLVSLFALVIAPIFGKIKKLSTFHSSKLTEPPSYLLERGSRRKDPSLGWREEVFALDIWSRKKKGIQVRGCLHRRRRRSTALTKESRSFAQKKIKIPRPAALYNIFLYKEDRHCVIYTHLDPPPTAAHSVGIIVFLRETSASVHSHDVSYLDSHLPVFFNFIFLCINLKGNVVLVMRKWNVWSFL